jgi:hypothetical protein
MKPICGALRLWSPVLICVGAVGIVLVVIGSIMAMLEATTFVPGLAMLLAVGPLVALFASGATALGQGVRARVDVTKYVQEQQSAAR